jgi:hypothetical protein
MSNWVDFASIKSNVPPAPVLRRYRVQLRRSGRDQYRGPCRSTVMPPDAVLRPTSLPGSNHTVPSRSLI